MSAVCRETGRPVLGLYPPAEKTGRLVRERLRSLLTAHPGLEDLGNAPSPEPAPRSPDAGEDAARRLTEAEERLIELERCLVGIGHNGPPEDLSDEGVTRSEFDQAREDIRGIKEQLAAKPDPAVVTRRTSRLKDFGLKVSAWIGGRATKLVDASISQLVPAAIAAGFITALISALKAVAHALGG